MEGDNIEDGHANLWTGFGLDTTYGIGIIFCHVLTQHHKQHVPKQLRKKNVGILYHCLADAGAGKLRRPPSTLIALYCFFCSSSKTQALLGGR